MHRSIPILVLLCGCLHAQVGERDRQAYGDSAPPSASAVTSTTSVGEYSSSKDTKIETSPFVRTPEVKRPKAFDWQAASNQSFFVLGIQHSLRMSQRKTRREFSGRFFDDYRDALSGLGGWGDSDSVFANYVGHPMQGAVTGFIQIQNDPRGIKQEFG